MLILNAYPIVLSSHVLTVSNFQILICSIESRNDKSPKYEVLYETKFSLKMSYSTHICLAQLDRHQTCKPVMVSSVSSSPTEGSFIFKDNSMLILFKKCQKCQICDIYENLV